MKSLPRLLAASALALAAPLAAHDHHEAAEPVTEAPAGPTESEPDAFAARLPDLPPGSNLVLRRALAAAEGIEVIVSDVVIPAGATVPRHYHPGEEFLYVIEGSATHVQEGQDDIELTAGDSYVIPARAVHAPRGGPLGARAIVFRVHVAGEDERVLVPED